MPDPPSIEAVLAEIAKLGFEHTSEKTKNKVKVWWQKRESGITMSPEEADQIKDIAKDPLYLTFKQYMGSHWSLKLIKIGIHLSRLNEKGLAFEAAPIQDEAFDKFGIKGKRIIQLASTGILIPIMDHLIQMKHDTNASPVILTEEFDKILSEWTTIATPISGMTEENTVRDALIFKMKAGCPILFVYAAGSATPLALEIMAKMNTRNEFRVNGYLPRSNHKTAPNQKDYLLWKLERFEEIAPKAEHKLSKIIG